MDSPRSDESSLTALDAPRWFAEQVQPHDAQLRGYLRGSFPSVRDVDDLVQDSYLRLWRVRAAGPIRSARALLFTVARRLAVDATRRQRASPFTEVDDLERLQVADEVPDVAENVGRQERVRLLGRAIGSLPERCREVFVLHKIHGLSRRETAERLKLAEKTVETQTARAMLRCGEFLKQHGVRGYFDDEAA